MEINDGKEYNVCQGHGKLRLLLEVNLFRDHRSGSAYPNYSALEGILAKHKLAKGLNP